MIDVNRWMQRVADPNDPFGNMPPEQDDDPVRKALSYLDPNPEADAVPPSASGPAAAGGRNTSGSLSSYNDPDAGGTISTPLPPQQPTYQNPDTLTYPPAPTEPPNMVIQPSGTPPTPGGQWTPVQTVPKPAEQAANPRMTYGRPFTPGMEEGPADPAPPSGLPSMGDLLIQSRGGTPELADRSTEAQQRAVQQAAGGPVAPRQAPVYRQEPAEDAAAQIERQPAYEQPRGIPTLPGEAGRTLSTAVSESAKSGGAEPISPTSILSAISALPFDAVQAAYNEANRSGRSGLIEGKDPLFFLRDLAAQQGVELPSAETLNPEGRPASVVLAGLLLSGILPDPLDPAASAVLKGTGRVIGAARNRVAGEVNTIRRVAGAAGERIAENAGRALPEGEMRLGSGMVPERVRGEAPERPHVYSPTPPEGVKRRYHGTAGKFDSVNPDTLNEQALYGPGYYTTSDPRVASSYAETGAMRGVDPVMSPEEVSDVAARVKKALDGYGVPAQIDEEALAGMTRYEASKAIGRQIDEKGGMNYQEARDIAGSIVDQLPPASGPNVRALDIPPNMNMIDADAPLTEDTLASVMTVVDRVAQRQPEVAGILQERLDDIAANMQRRAADGQIPLTNDAMLQAIMEAADQVKYRTGDAWNGRGLSTAILENAGFDGINHRGGQRVPMLDGMGKPIEHDVSVIFPGKVDKVTNAFSGTKGGLVIPGALAVTETDENGDPVGVDPLKAAGGMAVAGILNAKKFPGVQKALQASQLRAVRLAAAGVKPLNPLQWTGEFVKSVGYSSMIGIRTAATNLVGNVSEPIKALPRELARSITPKAAGGEGDLGHFGAWATGNAKGALQIPNEVKDALMARGHYASNPDMPNLSERTINPISHAIALLPELGGRVFSGLPDAIFGSLARGAGEEMSAARIVRDTPMPGMKPEQHMAQIMADKQAILAGTPPADATRLAQAQQVLKDGQSYSNDMTYRNSLGTVSEAVKTASGAKVPVLGSLTTPFFTTPHNMNLRLLENSPAGFAMNTHDRPGTMRTKFDRVYDATVGTAVIGGLVYGLGMQGTFTGSGPADPEQRRMLEATGWRPYSTLMTGTDGEKYYVPSKNFGNYGQLLNLIGELHDGIAYQKPGANAGEIMGDAAARIGKQVQDTAYASGLTELVHVLDKPAQAGMGYASSLATRATPYAASMRDIATSQDTLERKPEQSDGTLQGIGTELYQRWQAGTGIGRQELSPRTDVRGNPVENEQQGWRAFVPRGTRYRPDPLITELLGKSADLSAPRDHFTVTAAGADAPDGGIGTRTVRLTPKEQADWQRYRWEQLQQTFPMVNDPGFQNLPPSVKQKVWRDAVSAAGRTADGMLRQDLEPQWDSRVQGIPVKQAS